MSNAVAALADIYDESGKDIIAQNPQLLNKLLAALNESGEGQDSVQMIDSTIVRAHQHAAGAQKKRALRAKVLAVRAVASRPRSI